MKDYCFGIDIGGTTVKCGLFRTNGDLVDKWEIPTRTEDAGKNILPDIAAAVKAKMSEKNLTADDVEGVGVGVPGPVRHGKVPVAVNLHWGETDIVGILGGLTGLRVCAGNDANVAALGEMWKGGAEGCSDVIVVTLGTGVGGGIIVDGKLVEGAHGAGGEIGHIFMDENETDAILAEKLFPSAESKAKSEKKMPDFTYLHKELLHNGVSKKLLWTEYLEDCRQFGESPLMYSQFCYYFQQYEEKRRATMHINRKPGEQAEVDWAGDTTRIVDLIPVRSSKPMFSLVSCHTASTHMSKHFSMRRNPLG